MNIQKTSIFTFWDVPDGKTHEKCIGKIYKRCPEFYQNFLQFSGKIHKLFWGEHYICSGSTISLIKRVMMVSLIYIYFNYDFEKKRFINLLFHFNVKISQLLKKAPWRPCSIFHINLNLFVY